MREFIEEYNLGKCGFWCVYHRDLLRFVTRRFVKTEYCSSVDLHTGRKRSLFIANINVNHNDVVVVGTEV